MTSYAEARDWLFSRRRLGMRYGLDRMTALLEALGNPERSFRTIHVVGTNGKGSTTALLARTAEELGFVTGRTTSPHLLDYRERIAVSGRWIPPESVVRFVRRHRGVAEAVEATFFEITTAMAAWHFREAGVEWAVAEAGLGGRLDATRTFGGECTIFTGVDIEHRRILGPTKSAITAEKVAIARPGTILVAARQHHRVEEVISRAVEAMQLERACPLPGGDSPLPGEHQVRNSALARTAARLAFGRSEEEVDSAFARACRSLRWPGRLDMRRGSPDILFDVAHNPQSMFRLLEHLGCLGRKATAVAGFLEDKPWRRMAAMISGAFDSLIATTPASERLLPASRLRDELARLGVRASACDSIEEAVAEGRRLAEDLLVVTGSFYVVGEAMLACWRRGWIEPPEGEEAQVMDSPGGLEPGS